LKTHTLSVPPAVGPIAFGRRSSRLWYPRYFAAADLHGAPGAGRGIFSLRAKNRRVGEL
jgi:hypothetical protein